MAKYHETQDCTSRRELLSTLIPFITRNWLHYDTWVLYKLWLIHIILIMIKVKFTVRFMKLCCYTTGIHYMLWHYEPIHTLAETVMRTNITTKSKFDEWGKREFYSGDIYLSKLDIKLCINKWGSKYGVYISDLNLFYSKSNSMNVRKKFGCI